MRAVVIQAATGKAEEEPIAGAIGDDDSAVHDAGCRLGSWTEPSRRQRSARHALAALVGRRTIRRPVPAAVRRGLDGGVQWAGGSRLLAISHIGVL
jgi:hypothetical protein